MDLAARCRSQIGYVIEIRPIAASQNLDVFIDMPAVLFLALAPGRNNSLPMQFFNRLLAGYLTDKPCATHSLCGFQKQEPSAMASTFRLPLFLTSFAVVALIGTWATATDCCCSHCGCRQTKKMTRLVTTLEEIEVPVYECTTANSFRPKKGVVCKSGYRCDKFYKLYTKWCCKEHCVCHEHCEDITHYVDKNPCDSEFECHQEHHHEKHFDYRLTCRSRICKSCQVERGCKTLYGACPNGCTKRVCTKQPTGEVCTRVVPVVRWVTIHVCSQCDHRWSSDRTASR